MPGEQLIWRDAERASLEIEVTIGGQGLGQIMLLRYTQNNGLVEIPPNEDGAVGSAIYRFTTQEVASWGDTAGFQLRVAAGNPGGADMPVYLQVRQAGGPLTPINGDGDELETDELGCELSPPLENNVPGLWEFVIWMA